MILTTLSDYARYAEVLPGLRELMEAVAARSWATAEPGRHDVDAERLYINLADGQLGAPDTRPLEVHRAYADVHIVLEGEEGFGWRPLADCTRPTQPFDAAADCALYADAPATWLTLRPGDVAIVWPEDAHAPMAGEGSVRKLIGKVRLA